MCTIDHGLGERCQVIQFFSARNSEWLIFNTKFKVGVSVSQLMDQNITSLTLRKVFQVINLV